MKKHILLRFSVFLKGMAMGIADVIPGVSGGTIAIITGIYEEFLKTLNEIDTKIFKLIIKGKFRDAWNKYNLGFLSTLVLGILSSIVVLSHYITYLIGEHPISLWSFFFGLILAGIFFLFKEIKNWNFKNSQLFIPSKIYFILFGVSVAIIIQTLNPGTREINNIYLFFCGMISITAMLLPGVSGAYMLVLLGAYEALLNILKEVIKLNSEYFLQLASFILGAIFSVKLFSKFLTWSYNNHKNNTISSLVGFMIGSLPSLWPWKIKPFTNELFISNLYVPKGYFTNSEFKLGMFFIIIGFLSVLILEYLSKKNAKEK
tara:strand:+ start:2854 stop:3804 length:951 start_codon:yes stop_codon:yes gene_type:complete